MSQLKLDLAKLFDLHVLVIEADQDLLHLIKSMLLSLGIKKLSASRHVDELLHATEKLTYDVIFLDYAVDEQMNGAEIVEQLILEGVLPNKTRLVLLAADNERLRYAIDYPYHQVSYLSRPFHKQHLDSELKHHVMYGPWLKPILTLAGLGRYGDALKLLLHSQQQPLPHPVQTILQQLKIRLLLDLDMHDAAVPLLKSPINEQQGWALWALFRIRYERGDIAACEAFLHDSAEELQKYVERREVWQIFLAMQQADYLLAWQVASKIPNVGMSMKMVRLVHLVMVLAGKTEQAIDFIERKRRLAVKGVLFIQLTIAQARSVLYLMTHNTNPDRQPLLMAQLKQLLQQIADDKESHNFSENVLLLRTHLLSFEQGNEQAIHFYRQQHQNFAPEQQSVSVLCHAAVVCAELNQAAEAFDHLFVAQQILEQMLDNSSRVFAGCLFCHAFDFVIPKSRQAAAYAQMAQRHLNNQQQRQAMQLFHQAMRAAPDQPVYQQQLAQLMQQAGLHSYRGFRLPTAG